MGFRHGALDQPAPNVNGKEKKKSQVRRSPNKCSNPIHVGSAERDNKEGKNGRFCPKKKNNNHARVFMER